MVGVLFGVHIVQNNSDDTGLCTTQRGQRPTRELSIYLIGAHDDEHHVRELRQQERVGHGYDRRSIHDDPRVTLPAFFEKPPDRETSDKRRRIRWQLAGCDGRQILLAGRLGNDVKLEVFRAVVREPRLSVQT